MFSLSVCAIQQRYGCRQSCIHQRVVIGKNYRQPKENEASIDFAGSNQSLWTDLSVWFAVEIVSGFYDICVAANSSANHSVR